MKTFDAIFFLCVGVAALVLLCIGCAHWGYDAGFADASGSVSICQPNPFELPSRSVLKELPHANE